MLEQPGGSERWLTYEERLDCYKKVVNATCKVLIN